jgi:class 3 adenylate cyclase
MAAGEPVDHNEDMFGSTVNLASRICGVADVGHPLVAELVHDLGMKDGFSFAEARDVVLKGFPGQTRVFELLQRPA